MDDARTAGAQEGRGPGAGRLAIEYGQGLLAVAIATALASLLRARVAEPDLVMVYLLGVVLVASRVRLGPALATALLSVAAFDLFLVEPVYTFDVADARYVITFVVMAGVGVVLSSLTARLRLQARRAREAEARTAALYQLSHELVGDDELETLAQTVARALERAFACDAAIFVVDDASDGGLRLAAAAGEAINAPSRAAVDARGDGPLAIKESLDAGGRELLTLPLIGRAATLGAVVVRARVPGELRDAEARRLLGTFVGQVALALERSRMAAARKEAEMVAETERLRSTLLSSVSHDLRTPLGSIMGSATTLLDADANIDAATRRELLTAIHDEADRLGRLLNNLLAMTRIEGGGLKVKADWQVPEETVGAAIRRLGERARGRAIEVRIDPDVELVAFDGLMIELVLINLLDNALKYTPEGSPIEIEVTAADGEVVFAILDHGPGIPAAERERVFAKFFRGDGASGLAGAGLGLAISKAVVEAHGGRIVAGARDDGRGARFAFTIPTSTPPPAPGDGADAEAA